MRHFIVTSALASLLAACGSDQPEQAVAKSVGEFEGFVIPGTAVDAKAMGFTACTSDYYRATCRNEKAAILGVTVPAVINMDLNAGQMPIDLSQLAYQAIDFEIEPWEGRYPCEANGDPLVCVEPGPLRDLQQKLFANGWKMQERRSYRHFYHPKFEVEITVARAASVPRAGLSLAYLSRSEADEALETIAEAEASRRERTDAAKRFAEGMANAN